MLVEALKTVLNGINFEPLWIVMAALLGLSVLYCLLGYRYIRIAMGLGSLLFGTLSMIYFLQGSGWAPMTILIVSGIVGILLLVVSILFYAVDLGLLSALTIYLLVSQVLITFLSESLSPAMIQMLSVLTGIITAILALIFTKTVFVLVSSIGGGMLIAQLIVNGLVYQIHDTPTWLMWVLTIVGVGVGIYIQFGVSSRKIVHDQPRSSVFVKEQADEEEPAEPEASEPAAEE